MSKIQVRQQKILTLLDSTPISTNAQLAERLQVSLETIRKDLKMMAQRGEVTLVHGGVALAETPRHTGPAYHVRETLHAEQKSRIAQAASLLVSAGDSLILESSTTTVELAKALMQRPEILSTLVIITNSLRIVEILSGGNQCRRLFSLGGWVDHTEHATKGQYTLNALNDFHVDKAFLSGASANRNFYLTGFYDDDIAFQKAAIQVAKETVLLMDSSKFYSSAVMEVAHLSQLQVLVTDKDFSPEEQEALSSTKIRLVKI